MSAAHRDRASWVYRGVWSVLTDLFCVPQAPPALPAAVGTPGGRAEVMQPCEGWLRYRVVLFWLFMLVAACALAAAAGAIANRDALAGAAFGALVLALLCIAGVVIFLAIHLRFDTTWYVISDRSMRLRRGVWTVSETTITFENIQNVTVTQGPLQRVFGFSDLVVETAGGGGGGAHGHVNRASPHCGLIEGVAGAQALRELIMQRVRESRSAGLGDEPEGAAAPGPRAVEAGRREALERIARAAARLRAAAEGRAGGPRAA